MLPLLPWFLILLSSFQDFSSLCLILLWWIPFLLCQTKYFAHVICLALTTLSSAPRHEHLLVCLLHKHLCMPSNIVLVYFKGIYRHKINILKFIKYLLYYNSYYLPMCPSVTSIKANSCMTTVENHLVSYLLF